MRVVTVPEGSLPNGRTWLAVEQGGATVLYVTGPLGEYVGRRLLQRQQISYAV
jgi:hypothetical protein